MIRLPAAALTVDECRDGPDRREDEQGEPHVRVLPWRLEDSAERHRKRGDDVDEPEPPDPVPAQRPLAEDLEVVLHAGSNTLGRPGAYEPGADGNQWDEEEREPARRFVAVRGNAQIIEKPDSGAIHGIRLEEDACRHAFTTGQFTSESRLRVMQYTAGWAQEGRGTRDAGRGAPLTRQMQRWHCACTPTSRAR